MHAVDSLVPVVEVVSQNLIAKDRKYMCVCLCVHTYIYIHMCIIHMYIYICINAGITPMEDLDTRVIASL